MVQTYPELHKCPWCNKESLQLVSISDTSSDGDTTTVIIAEYCIDREGCEYAKEY